MNPSEIEFPVDCHFKIICKESDVIRLLIERVLLSLDIVEPLTEGNRSEQKKYITYNVKVRVESKEWMNRIDADLRSIPGVKMVL